MEPDSEINRLMMRPLGETLYFDDLPPGYIQRTMEHVLSGIYFVRGIDEYYLPDFEPWEGPGGDFQIRLNLQRGNTPLGEIPSYVEAVIICHAEPIPGGRWKVGISCYREYAKDGFTRLIELMKREGGVVARAENPWDMIPDVGWDRRAVKGVWEGKEDGEIARELGRNMAAKTVSNRLSDLRKLYGTEVVPHRRMLGRNRE